MAFWRSGELLPMPRDLPKSEGKVYDIMKECWSLDPERRCQPKQIIRDLISLLQGEFYLRWRETWIGCHRPITIRPIVKPETHLIWVISPQCDVIRRWMNVGFHIWLHYRVVLVTTWARSHAEAVEQNLLVDILWIVLFSWSWLI